MIRWSGLVGVLLGLLIGSGATAHEIRPAYLAVTETPDGAFDVYWKVPAQGDQRLGLYVRLPQSCAPLTDPIRSIDGGAYAERWTARCGGGLAGQRIAIDGLSSTLTDTLARIAYRDGSVEIARLTPDAPSFVAAGAQSTAQVARTYFGLGVDHILSGLDHLLFVFALILLIQDRWMLAKTITAFTVAHSVTLAAASLGYFSLPQKPVEAAIALSITLVAREILMLRPNELRTAERLPSPSVCCTVRIRRGPEGDGTAADRRAARPPDLQPGGRSWPAALRRRRPAAVSRRTCDHFHAVHAPSSHSSLCDRHDRDDLACDSARGPWFSLDVTRPDAHVSRPLTPGAAPSCQTCPGPDIRGPCFVRTAGLLK